MEFVFYSVIVSHKIPIMNIDGTIYPAACKRGYITEVSADSSPGASKPPVRGPIEFYRKHLGELACAHIKQERLQLLTVVVLLFKEK